MAGILCRARASLLAVDGASLRWPRVHVQGGAGTLIDKLSFLKSADGGAASPDEERLMQLFQNRAGLKKAYADLKDEFHLLRDRLKQQEGATIRVQEQLDALGDLLGDPKT